MMAKECMTRNVKLGSPTMSLAEAAKLMKDGDFGILPVGDKDRLVGMITDRDITIRAVSEGKDPNRSYVGEVMSKKVLYCFEDQEINEVVKNLGHNQIRRLPVLSREKRLVGILSLGNIAESGGSPKEVDEALIHICKKK